MPNPNPANRCPNVCFWRKSDILNALTNVRFWGQSGQGPTAAYQISIYEQDLVQSIVQNARPAEFSAIPEFLWEHFPRRHTALAAREFPT